MDVRQTCRHRVDKGRRVERYTGLATGSGKHSRAAAQYAALMGCRSWLRSSGMMAGAGFGGCSLRGRLQKTHMDSRKRHRA